MMKTKGSILFDKPLLLFLLFLLVAYLPIFLPFFHLKNDVISQNLPTRYIISESLYSGYFPWWNPYINFGIPQYGDMNNGFWNPFLWLIAKIFGYNIWTITYEEMFYILIGSWGIYKVVKECGIRKEIAIITGLSYMCCGYLIGHLQHFCWITGTGFFPYVLLYFLKINRLPSVKNYILGCIAVFLFISSTHPGLVIGAAYFFLFALVLLFLFRNTWTRTWCRPNFWLVNLIFLVFCIAFCVGVVVSDLDVLLHISRGSKLSLEQSAVAPTTFQSYLSILFPLAVNKSQIFLTDISMRNVFVGFPVIIGFVFFFHSVNRKILILISIGFLFFALVAAGGIFKPVFYYALPLFGYVRLNGEFTYFAVIILLLSGAYGLQNLWAAANPAQQCGRLLVFFEILITIGIAAALWLMFVLRSSIFFKPFTNPGDLKLLIKQTIAHVELADLLLINGLVQLTALFFIRRNCLSPQRVALIGCLNLMVNAWLILPFTGLGMESRKQIHGKMFSPPRGVSAQELLPLSKMRLPDSSLRKEFILVGSYQKKIGDTQEEQYPVELNSTRDFFNDTVLHHFINNQSYIFLSTDTTTSAKTNFDSSLIRIDRFGPGHFELSINNTDYRFITFLQNDYAYWHTFVNGRMRRHYTGFKTFITMPIEKGMQHIECRFEPTPIKMAMLANLIIISIGLLVLLHPGVRNKLLIK